MLIIFQLKHQDDLKYHKDPKNDMERWNIENYMSFWQEDFIETYKFLWTEYSKIVPVEIDSITLEQTTLTILNLITYTIMKNAIVGVEILPEKLVIYEENNEIIKIHYKSQQLAYNLLNNLKRDLYNVYCNSTNGNEIIKPYFNKLYNKLIDNFNCYYGTKELLFRSINRKTSIDQTLNPANIIPEYISEKQYARRFTL